MMKEEWRENWQKYIILRNPLLTLKIKEWNKKLFAKYIFLHMKNYKIFKKI